MKKLIKIIMVMVMFFALDSCTSRQYPQCSAFEKYTPRAQRKFKKKKRQYQQCPQQQLRNTDKYIYRQY